jgi:hypothetical protein
MIQVARMLTRRFESVIAFLRHRVTNATRDRGQAHGKRFSE